ALKLLGLTAEQIIKMTSSIASLTGLRTSEPINDLVTDPIIDTISHAVVDLVRDSVRDSVTDPVRDSVRDSHDYDAMKVNPLASHDYDAICIAGGGCKAVSLLGLLYEWDVRGRLNDISTWSACSVGGFISVLLMCGVNPLKMLNYYPKIKHQPVSMEMFTTLMRHAGLLHIQNYTRKFCSTVERFTGIKNPSLQQFYEKTGKMLYISAVNVSKEEIVYLNHIDYPDVSLFSALWASAAIPGVFIPIRINGDLFVDGGLYHSLPLEPILDMKTVAFNYEPVQVGSLDSIVSLLKINMTIAKKEVIKRHKELRLVLCKCNFGLLDFDKTPSQLLEEFDFGRRQFQ
ncbi:MAG: patatin-like phospholipase family protein, partial [Candidatus Saccharibacteria bacterium]